jgi:hypothetical protein
VDQHERAAYPASGRNNACRVYEEKRRAGRSHAVRAGLAAVRAVAVGDSKRGAD